VGELHSKAQAYHEEAVNGFLPRTIDLSNPQYHQTAISFNGGGNSGNQVGCPFVFLALNLVWLSVSFTQLFDTRKATFLVLWVALVWGRKFHFGFYPFFAFSSSCEGGNKVLSFCQRTSRTGYGG